MNISTIPWLGVFLYHHPPPGLPHHNPCQSESLSSVPRASGNIVGPNPGSKILVKKLEIRLDFMT